MQTPPTPIKVCRYCRDLFRPSVWNQKFCSYSCKKMHWYRIQKRLRALVGELYKVKNSDDFG
jgi:hypothetical protein